MTELVPVTAVGAVLAALKAPVARAAALAAPLPAKVKVPRHFNGIAPIPVTQAPFRIVTAIRRLCHCRSVHSSQFVTVKRSQSAAAVTADSVTAFAITADTLPRAVRHALADPEYRHHGQREVTNA